jgi:hypothetical protein
MDCSENPYICSLKHRLFCFSNRTEVFRKMHVRQLTVEDAYRELNDVRGVVAVTTDGSGGLTVEHKNARDEIEAVLERSTWSIVDTAGLAGQYPMVDVAPETDQEEN